MEAGCTLYSHKGESTAIVKFGSNGGDLFIGLVLSVLRAQ